MNHNQTAGAIAKRFRRSLRHPWAGSPGRALNTCRLLLRTVLLSLFFLSVNAFAANDEAFDSLKVGDRTYQNVKVTTKGKSFIIISHSGGISSIKVSELPLNALQK